MTFCIHYKPLHPRGKTTLRLYDVLICVEHSFTVQPTLCYKPLLTYSDLTLDGSFSTLSSTFVWIAFARNVAFLTSRLYQRLIHLAMSVQSTGALQGVSPVFVGLGVAAALL